MLQVWVRWSGKAWVRRWHVVKTYHTIWPFIWDTQCRTLNINIERLICVTHDLRSWRWTDEWEKALPSIERWITNEKLSKIMSIIVPCNEGHKSQWCVRKRKGRSGCAAQGNWGRPRCVTYSLQCKGVGKSVQGRRVARAKAVRWEQASIRYWMSGELS
jgi:hypothetical protein